MWFRMVHDQLLFATLTVSRFSRGLKYKNRQHQDVNHAKVCHFHLELTNLLNAFAASRNILSFARNECIYFFKQLRIR